VPGGAWSAKRGRWIGNPDIRRRWLRCWTASLAPNGQIGRSVPAGGADWSRSRAGAGDTDQGWADSPAIVREQGKRPVVAGLLAIVFIIVGMER